LIKRFNIKKGLKVVIDPAKSTPGVIIPDLLRRVGCEVVEKNCDLDGNFPLGIPDPTELVLAERLSREVFRG